MDALTKEELKGKTVAELTAYNQQLMAAVSKIQAHQLEVKAEINSRAVADKFAAMPDAEKQALIQYINAGNLSTGLKA